MNLKNNGIEKILASLIKKISKIDKGRGLYLKDQIKFIGKEHIVYLGNKKVLKDILSQLKNKN